MEVDWGTVADWRDHSQEFGALRSYDDGRLIPVMEYRPEIHERWRRLREAWLDLPPHPNILEAIDVDGDVLLLRYAALNWRQPKLAPRAKLRELAAVGRWAIQLASAYRFLSEQVPEDLGLFWNALVKVDIGDQVRLAFKPAAAHHTELPPELLVIKPRWDERTLTFIVGRLLRSLLKPKIEFPLVVTASQEDPARRHQSLRRLEQAAELLAGVKQNIRHGDELEAWSHIEEGIAWLELGDYPRANGEFQIADATGHYSEIARWGLQRAREMAGIGRSGEIVVPKRIGTFAPKTIPDLPSRQSRVEVALECLRAGDHRRAFALAEGCLGTESDAQARVVMIDALLARRDPEKALSHADDLLRIHDDAQGHYLRGKCLLALGRVHEARDAFDSALALSPKMLEAMLLRREVDRAIATTRHAVGEQKPIAIHIPPGLAELRDVLLSGDAKRAIAALGESRFADDPDAQLVLARFHVFDGDNYRAAHVYDAVATRWPARRFEALLGKANALLDFGYHQSALAMFDQLVAEKATDLDASEGRARALDKLGRTGEAAAEFRRFVGLSTSGSDLRVRVAQAWLDAHPL